MKKSILAMLVFFVLGGQRVCASAPAVSAQSAVVYHAGYGTVLWEKASDIPRLIASTTKIMTALVAIEQGDLQDTVVITEEMANVEGSSMYLRIGETYTLQELLYGLLLASGNDAATAIAIHTAGSQEGFATLMNQKADALGLMDTHFENPHGLDHENHYSTALDLARLMAYAMEKASFAEICGTSHITLHNLTYVNHNKLLWQCEGVIGGKTGYTMAAGRTLVTCCEREGQRIICVTLSAPDDWNDHKHLYDWVFSTWQNRSLIQSGERFSVPVVSHNGTILFAEPLQDVTVFANPSDQTELVVELPRFEFPPVYVGDKAGCVRVHLNHKPVCSVPLIYMNEFKLNENRKGLFWFLPFGRS